jgi:alpha-glucosidase
MRKQLQVIIFFVFVFAGQAFSQQTLNLQSPNERILVRFYPENVFSFDVMFDSVLILEKTEISMTLNDKYELGVNSNIRQKISRTVNQVIHPVVQEKNKNIPDHFNEVIFKCKGNYNISFRAYNEGIAWRFETQFKEDVIVNTEQADLRFPKSSKVWFPEENSFFSHNERYYLHLPLDSITTERFCSLPALVESSNDVKILITESSLRDYPGMWLKGTDGFGMSAIFPGVVVKENQTNDRNVKPEVYAGYIAETKGARTFPWRILAIAENDAGLVTNQLSYLLAEPCKIEDPSWIKPGKVAWDWWNDWNIYGVDFESGVNTDTYKYYIDFASANGIEYIIMDEGWYKLGDLMAVVPEIDMDEILDYAKQKNVGIILWVIWKTLDDQWKEAFDQFEKWGVKGIKVDFMQRDDQWMVDYYWRVAEEAAKRKMLVDFHGAYKPSGLRRTYPNVISREGVKGLENAKWSEHQTPTHDVIVPFIRMVAGPMDYTPGVMVNSTKKNFKASWSQPMSMGTRCHQLAMYVVYESPLQMLCDNPSNYKKEPEAMKFLSRVPVVWDTTIVLSAKIADHILMARQNESKWYMGAMTNWDPKELEFDLSFLGSGNYTMEIWQDGINAHRYAGDFKKEMRIVSSTDKMKIKLAPGGGWVAIVTLTGNQ